jgi:hypothetical protein
MLPLMAMAGPLMGMLGGLGKKKEEPQAQAQAPAQQSPPPPVNLAGNSAGPQNGESETQSFRSAISSLPLDKQLDPLNAKLQEFAKDPVGKANDIKEMAATIASIKAQIESQQPPGQSQPSAPSGFGMRANA